MLTLDAETGTNWGRRLWLAGCSGWGLPGVSGWGVSGVGQNPGRQLDGIGLDRVFTDTVSGKPADRPQLQATLAFARDVDTVIVHSMDRLARNLGDLRRLVRELTGHGVAAQQRGPAG